MTEGEQVNLQIFCAALNGFVASSSESTEVGAVEFARNCVRLSYSNDPERKFPDLIGKR